MRKHFRLASIVIAVGLLGLLIAVPRGQSADDNKEIRDAVEKLAAVADLKGVCC